MITDLLGFAAITTFLLLVLVMFSILGGFANTIDTIALTMHRAAVNIRAYHARRTAKLRESWVRQMEADGGPVGGEPDKLLIIPYGSQVSGRTARQAAELEG